MQYITDSDTSVVMLFEQNKNLNQNQFAIMLHDWLPSNQGWILTILSSLISVLGCFIIYADDLYILLTPKFISQRYKFNLEGNYTFMTGALAFSSGSLLFTALFRLLPKAQSYIAGYANDEKTISNHPNRTDKIYLIVSYIGGMIVNLVFNYVLHVATSESVVHCNHGYDTRGEGNHDVHAHEHNQNHSHNDSHNHYHDSHKQGHNHLHESLDRHQIREVAPASVGHEGAHENHDMTQVNRIHPEADESTHILIDTNSAKAESRNNKKKSLIHLIAPRDANEIGECKGYSSAEICSLLESKKKHSASTDLHYCDMPISGEIIEADVPSYGSVEADESSYSLEDQSNEPGDINESTANHHHHVTPPLARLLSIGIQSLLAITLHKIPEGFVTFVTSNTDPKLGFSIFLSLVLHNLTEGFSMSLPLYYSFSSGKFPKLKAASMSAFLGGFAQPIGALLGVLFLKSHPVDSDIDYDQLRFIFGETIAVTSGFLTMIGLSMFGSAVSFGGSVNFVLIWCILGVAVIALSYVVT